MGQYLDKFKDVIGQRQTQQVLRLLNKKRNSGQIRTVEEFSTQLEDLVRELTETTLKPTMALFEAESNQEIDSETYNFMLERVSDDLESAFEEANNINEVQISHQAIIKDVILKNLRSGIAELESKIELYEFLNKDLRGFDSAIFTTFRESKENRTDRGGEFTSVLFLDPRIGDLIESEQDATVELVGERLTLSNANKTLHSIRGVRQIFDDSTPQSELIAEPAGVEIRNIVDGQKGTYWIQSLLYSNKRESTRTKLELDLGIVREVNFVDIEPAVKFPIVLEDISYLDGSNVIVSLGIPQQEISSPASIRIRRTATSRIILTFRNDHDSRVEFEYNPNKETLYSQALLQPPEGIQPTLGDVSNDLNNLMASAKVKAALGVSLETASVFSGYEFLIGFDNIRLGLVEFQPRSIYVSSPLIMSGSGEIGLKTLESRPFTPVPVGDVQFTEDTYDHNEDNETGGNNSRNFLGAIEYWVVKQDLNTSGTLLKTSVFPILPLGVQRIHHERLVLTEKSTPGLTNNDIGTFMFFTNVVDGDVKVYRNFQPLADQTGNPFATEGWKLEPETGGQSLRTPASGTRMRFKVRILNPLPTDIFTVTYSPLLSTTKALPQSILEFTGVGGVQVVDLVGDLSARSAEGQLVVVDIIGEEESVDQSKIYLVVILRQNTADSSLTPAVEEYTLVAGNKDPTKFEGV